MSATKTMEERITAVKAKMFDAVTKPIAIDPAKVAAVEAACRASPEALAVFKAALDAFTRNLHSHNATNKTGGEDAWFCECCCQVCPFNSKYDRDFDCTKCSRKVCRDCVTSEDGCLPDYDEETGDSYCVCAMCDKIENLAAGR